MPFRHYKYTYDWFRRPTPLEHFIEDFENQTGYWRYDARRGLPPVGRRKRLAGEKRFHENYPLHIRLFTSTYSDEHNFRALLSYIFQEVTADIYKT